MFSREEGCGIVMHLSVFNDFLPDVKKNKIFHTSQNI